MKGLAVALMVVGVLAAAGGAIGVVTNNGGSKEVVAFASPTSSVPVSPAPAPSGSVEPSASPSPAVAETVQQFFPLFAAAFRNGDAAFLLARLHPAVITLYGQQQCETYTGTLTDPTRAYRITSVSAPGTYAYSPDGRSIQVPDVLTVGVRQTAYGQKATGPVHLAVVDGTVRWFTDCGTPQ